MIYLYIIYNLQELIYYIMKKTIMESNNNQNKHIQIVTFHHQTYPFKNIKDNKSYLFSTQIDQELDEQQLTLLRKINHPHILTLYKIIRKFKLIQNQRVPYYLLQYEQVPYAIQYVISNRGSWLFDKIKSINLREILIQLTTYLIKYQIYYSISTKDIGVTSNGQIKIYIPVSHIFSTKSKTLLVKVLQNNFRLSQWFKQKFILPKIVRPNSGISPQYSTNIHQSQNNLIIAGKNSIQEDNKQRKKSNNQSIISLQINQNHKQPIAQSTVYKHQNPSRNTYIYTSGRAKPISILKNSNDSFRTQVHKITTTHQDRMQRLLHKLNIIKQKKQTQTSLSNSIKKLGENSRNALQKNKLGMQKSIQKIQQNIHCINIFNHPTYHSPVPQKRPSIKFQSYTPVIQNSYHQPKIQQNQNIIEYDDPNNYSMDTYDIQFNHHQQLPEPKKINPHERERSQRNYKINKKKQISKIEHSFINKKNVAQSAGPLQFKNIVSKLSKPINKYEQQKSQLSKRQNTINSRLFYKDQQKTQKNIRSLQTIKLFSVHESQNSEHTLSPVKQKGKDERLDGRIKDVLSKAKNAVAILNKMKQSKGMF